jgi:hypothetical protein
MRRIILNLAEISFFVLLLLVMPFMLQAQINQSQTKVEIKQLYPRNGTYEYQMLKAMGFNPNPSITNVDLNETLKLYKDLTPLEQAFGRLGLLAAEIYATELGPEYDGQKMLNTIRSANISHFKPKMMGVLAVLVMNEVSKNSGESSIVALKNWSTDLFRSFKIRTARSILDEYTKWKNNPCNYRTDGYTPPPNCFTGGHSELFSAIRPPVDVITKSGLKKTWDTNADRLANAISMSLSSIALTSASIGLANTLTTSVCLNASFSTGGGGASIAGGLGWASVVAAPVAATLMAIVVGTTEGFALVEATKVEPMLKMKLGQAMTESINITNMVKDANTRDMFYMAFMESSIKGFQESKPKVDGELRFYCQAGYVSKFKLSYLVNKDATGYFSKYEPVEFNTKDLSVGNEESFEIPYDAKDIRVQGYYSAGGWKEIFNQSLAAPTFLCYTTYGTIFDARYKNDCPEVGNMVAKPNELTVTQGGGYTAWVTLTYNQNGKTVVLQDQQGLTLGWRKMYSIPKDAQGIRLQIKNATGLAWEPWKTVIDKTWPLAPNECIKVYGTTLDPKWNNECN